MSAFFAQPMLSMPWRVRDGKRETTDTYTLELLRKGPEPAPPFEPGQFNMLYVFGAGEVAISISGDPGSSETLVHTVRAVGGVTRAIAALRKGQAIGVRGPYGRGWPIEDAQGMDIVVAAGGIGLAPLRPLIYHVLRHRDDYGRFVLLYGARTPEDMLYKKELERWRGRFDMDVHVTVDRATGDWRGNVGVVTELVPRAAFDPYDAACFICGPEIMMRYTIEALGKRGVPRERLYVSLERNMKCAVGFCGHCQYGPKFICKDGPVFPYAEVAALLPVREL